MKKYEECMVLYGWKFKHYWIGYGKFYTAGDLSTVKFDYTKINLKKLIGFWHTHPQWIATPSLTDFYTMNAWTTTVGKNLFCAITGIDGNYNHQYRFNRVANSAADPKERFYKVGRLFFGVYQK